MISTQTEMIHFIHF